MLVEQSLRKAIKLCGKKQKGLADAIGVKPDQVRYWLNSSLRIPFHFAIGIELATKGEVSRYDLAPYARFKNNRVNDLNIKEIPRSKISEQVSVGIEYENSLNELKKSKNFYAVKGRIDVLAAEKAGFKNNITYRQAKKVVSQGIFKLVQAMDLGRIAISTAVLLAEKSPEEQEILLQKDKKQIIAALKHEKNKTSEGALLASEKEYRLPLRLVLLGLKTYCSKENLFPWDPEQLKNQLLPYTEIDFNQILNALARSGYVSQENQFYGRIIKESFQRIET
jgi:DNA-binding transcriptional regulator YdaS (Cro superfamily)